MSAFWPSASQLLRWCGPVAGCRRGLRCWRRRLRLAASRQPMMATPPAKTSHGAATIRSAPVTSTSCGYARAVFPSLDPLERVRGCSQRGDHVKMAARATGTARTAWSRTTGRNSRLHLISTAMAYRDHIDALTVRQVLASAPGCPGHAQTAGMIAMTTMTITTNGTPRAQHQPVAERGTANVCYLPCHHGRERIAAGLASAALRRGAGPRPQCHTDPRPYLAPARQ